MKSVSTFLLRTCCSNRDSCKPWSNDATPWTLNADPFRGFMAIRVSSEHSAMHFNSTFLHRHWLFLWNLPRWGPLFIYSKVNHRPGLIDYWRRNAQNGIPCSPSLKLWLSYMMICSSSWTLAPVCIYQLEWHSPASANPFGFLRGPQGWTCLCWCAKLFGSSKNSINPDWLSPLQTQI